MENYTLIILIFSIVALVLWLIIGVQALLSEKEISKSQYATCWVTLIIELVIIMLNIAKEQGL